MKVIVDVYFSVKVLHCFLSLYKFIVSSGASEPKNMAYMNRLGLWGPGTAFKDFNEFLQSVEKRFVFIKSILTV